MDGLTRTKVENDRLLIGLTCRDARASKKGARRVMQKENGQIRNKLCAPWGNKSNQGLWQARSTLDTYNKR